MTDTRVAERAYTVKEAAGVKSVSPDLILRAIRSAGGKDNPVPLAAKRVGKGYRVTASDLDAWYAALPDA